MPPKLLTASQGGQRKGHLGHPAHAAAVADVLLGLPSVSDADTTAALLEAVGRGLPWPGLAWGDPNPSNMSVSVCPLALLQLPSSNLKQIGFIP